MKRILSTVRLRDEMIQDLKDGFEDIEYRFLKPKEVTDEDRGWCNIFVTYGSDMAERDVDAFANLEWIMVMSAGLDDMPLDRLGDVHITNAKGIHKIQMAEYTIGLLLSYYKDFHQLQVDQKNSHWRKNAKTEELHGKKVHILGTGSIGSHLATVLDAFGTETTGYNTNGGSREGFLETHPVDGLMDHIGEADIVINILPSTEATRGLLDVPFFENMKESAVFVNIGRGDIMTDETIIEVLDRKLIRHMILDVFNEEPLPQDHAFYGYGNLTITPHASSKTDGYLTRAFDIFIYNMEQIDNKDSMRNVIDIGRGY